MKTYKVTVGGIEHTMRLSDEDAKKYPAATEVKAAEAPQNKARKPSNKAAASSDDKE